jgi:prevent-host-death family protein
MEVNLYEAKTKLSQLVERAMVGEEIIIAKAGKPMVKLVRLEEQPKRILGSASGTITYTEDWYRAMTQDELDAFTGS